MESQSTKVWDPVVRIGHWSLVILFATSWLTGESESDLHIYSGYALVSLVLFRLAWGFVGSRHARFSDFLYSPSATFAYLRGLLSGTPRHYEGHNPLGGWMIVALLSCLLLTGASGLALYGAEGHGPLAGVAMPSVDVVASAYADEDDDDHESHRYGEEGHEAGGDEQREEFWEEVHEFFSSLTLLLVFVHIGGVFVASLLHQENLVKAMLTGRKARPE